MKRSSPEADLDDIGRCAARPNLERILADALQRPCGALLQHLKPEVRQVLAQRGTSLQVLLRGCQQQAAAPPPDLDGLHLDNKNAEAESANVPSATTPMAPSLSRQASYAPSLLTDRAIAEDLEATMRCVNVVTRFVRQCDALSSRAGVTAREQDD